MSLPSLASLSLSGASGAPEAPTGAPGVEQQLPSLAEEVFQRADFRNLILSFLASSSSPDALSLLSFVRLFCTTQKLICDDSTYEMIVTQHIGPPMTDLVRPGEVTRLWPESGGSWERVFATIMIGLNVLPRYQQLAFINCTDAQRARWRLQLERAMEYRMWSGDSAARSNDPIWGNTTSVAVHPELQALVARLRMANELPLPSIRLSELGTPHEEEHENILDTLRILFFNGGSLDTAIDVSELTHRSWPEETGVNVSDLLFQREAVLGISISMKTVQGILHLMVDMGMSTERILAFYTAAPLNPPETSPLTKKIGSLESFDDRLVQMDRHLMAGTHDSQQAEIIADTVYDDPRFKPTHPLIWIYMSPELTHAFTDKNPLMKQLLFWYWFSVFAGDLSNPCPPVHVQMAIGRMPPNEKYMVGLSRVKAKKSSLIRLESTRETAQALNAKKTLAEVTKAFAWLAEATSEP